MKSIYLLILSFFVISCSQYNSPMPHKNVQQEINLPNENDKFFSSTNAESFYMYKNNILNMINEVRVQGTKCSPPTAPLRYNIFLEKAAMAHAKDLALNNYIGHNGSGSSTDPAKKAIGVGSYFVDRILYFGYPAKRYNLLGENVTKIKYIDSKKEDIKKNFKLALKKFISDPPHCKILMNPRFEDVGVGVYKANGNYYWVVDFGETTSN